MEKLFVVLVAIGFTILNSLHVITQWLTNPSDRIFTGIAHYFADYFLYVDVMAQGAAGRLMSAARFTNEPIGTTWVYWFNTLLGWLGNLVGLSPFASYNVFLILLVLCLCLLWYFLVKHIFPKNRFAQMTSFLFILTASNFNHQGEFWFSPTPAFNRLGGVPHQVFQTILLVVATILFSKQRMSVLTSVVGFFTALTNPIQTIVLVAATGLLSLRDKRLLPFLSIAIPAFLGAWFTNREFSLQPLLTAAKIWENSQHVSVPLVGVFLALGPLALLVPFGMRSMVKTKDPLRFLLFVYGMCSFVAFFSPIPTLLHTSPVRWLHPAPYALLAIVATEGLSRIKNYEFRMKGKRIPATVLYSLFFILYSLLTIPTLYSQIDARTNPKWNTILASNLNHVPKPVIDALTWLKIQPDNGRSVVLTDPALPYDVLVPVFTGKISFTGHPIHTLYPDVKASLRQRFFNGEMNESEAKQFLANHRIGFAISNKENLPFAVKIFSNASLSIFSF